MLTQITANLAHPNNQFFVTLILLTLGIGLSSRHRAMTNQQAPSTLLRMLPTLCTSLGILGTFFGIYLGLLEFDPQDIRQSVPVLLDGMKTAFVTSLLGIGSGLILKIQYAHLDGKQAAQNPDTSDDPIVLLKGIKEAVSDTNEVLTACFRGDEEYSMLSQMKLIRSEITKTRTDLVKAFQDFAEDFAEQGTAQLIEALEEVMGRFNALLNDLVQSAFDDLKVSVEHLNKWQSDHREHLEMLSNKLTTTLDALWSVSHRLEESAEHIKGLDQEMTSIAQALESLALDGEQLANASADLKRQNQQLQASLEAIAAVGEEAKAVVPSLNTHLTEYTDKLASSLDKQRSQISETLRSLEQSVEQSAQGIQSMQSEHKQAVEANIKNLATTLDEQIRAMNKGLESSLTASLQSLVGALGRVSEKFVEDYTPLTDRLHHLVHAAEGRRHAH